MAYANPGNGPSRGAGGFSNGSNYTFRNVPGQSAVGNWNTGGGLAGWGNSNGMNRTYQPPIQPAGLFGDPPRQPMHPPVMQPPPMVPPQQPPAPVPQKPVDMGNAWLGQGPAYNQYGRPWGSSGQAFMSPAGLRPANGSYTPSQFNGSTYSSNGRYGGR